MRITAATIVDGKLVTDSDAFANRGSVTVLSIDDDDDGFELTPDMIAELREAVAQADRGEGVPANVVLAEMDAIARGARSR